MTFLNAFRTFNFGLIRRGLVSCVSVAAVVAVCFVGAAAQAQVHITLCHRTGSATNPYIRISPDVESVIKEGHLDHDQIGNGLGGDIIPLFEFQGQSYSKNLDTDLGGGMRGRDVLANDCQIRHHTPTPTPTLSSTPTATPSPGMVTLEVIPCETNNELRRVRFVGQLLGLTFFLNGQEVVPDANGEVQVAPGHYHWEVFRGIQRIAEGEVDVGICGIITTPTPTSSPTPTPGMTPTPTPPEVPEPSTILMLATGLMLGLGVFAFRKLRG